MASDKNLQELFHETLKDIYFAEKKILSALPKMAKAAQSEDLKAAFEKHEAETEEHVNRLAKVFEEIDETPRGKTCDAIMGIIEDEGIQGCACPGRRPPRRGPGGRALRDRALRDA
jgi:ferritin-like metal-binding protein YciE